MKNKKILIFMLLISLIIVLSATFTYAWFLREIVTDPVKFSSGDLNFRLSIYEYNDDTGLLHKVSSKSTISLENSEFISLDSNEFDNNTRGNLAFNFPEYEVSSFIDSNPRTLYLLIEKLDGSIDFDYSLSFNLDGFCLTPDGITLNNLAFAGGFSFGGSVLSSSKLSDGLSVDSSVRLSNGDELTNLEKILFEYCESYSNEYSVDSGALSELYQFVPQDRLSEENNFDFFRLDVHSNSSAMAQEYAERSFIINAKVFASQVNALTQEDRDGAHYYVDTNAELDQILQTYKPGDSIHINSDIVYNKDLVFNRPAKLYVNGKKLRVFGNLVFSYGIKDEEGSLVDTSGNGQIVISKIGNTGGFFKINTPNSRFEIAGSNSEMLGKGDINIQSDFLVKCSYDEGLIINNSKIYSTNSDGEILTTENYYKKIIIQDGTRIDVSSTSHIGDVVTDADTDVEKIAIFNRGVINYIECSEMHVNNTMINTPQIYIYNNGELVNNRIVLPSWSNTYNTIIIQGFKGTDTQVVGSDSTKPNYFSNANISKENPDALVELIEDNPYELLVHYTDTVGPNGETVVNTLESILETFYTNSLSNDPNELAYSKTKTTKLVVRTYGSKCITANDYDYLNDMVSVVDMDLSQSNTYSTNVTIKGVANRYAVVPDNAFAFTASARGQLTNLKLPNNTQYIGRVLTSYCNVEEIYLPPNVLALNKERYYHSMYNIKYVHITSPYKLIEYFGDASYSGTPDAEKVPYFLVNENLLTEYRSPFYSTPSSSNNYPAKAQRFLPESHFDSKKEYLIRKVDNFNYEIVKYFGIRNSVSNNWIHNEPLVIGDNEISNNRIYELGETDPINVVSIHDYAYIGIYKTISADIELRVSENIKRIGKYAFYESKIKDLLLEGVQYLDVAAFSNSTLYNVEARSLQEVKNYGFSSCQNLVSANFSEESGGALGIHAFGNCKNLLFITSGTESIDEYCFYACSKLKYAFLYHLNSIGDDSFNSCNSLRYLIIGRLSRLTNQSRINTKTTIIVNDLDVRKTNLSSIYSYSFVTFMNTSVYEDGVSQISSFCSNICDNYYNKNYSITNMYLDSGIRLLDVKSYEEMEESSYIVLVDEEDQKSIILTYLKESFVQDPIELSEDPSVSTITLLSKVTLNGIDYPVTEVSPYAFHRVSISCDKLIIPTSLEFIAAHSFSNEQSNKSIKEVVGDVDEEIRVKEIGRSGFFNVGLEKFIANELEEIGMYVFYGSAFIHVNFPKLVSIGDYSFTYARQLHTVSLNMDNNMGRIGYNAFQYCSNLKYFESGANTVDTYAFNGLTTEFIKMPYLENLVNYCFDSLTSLRYLIIGRPSYLTSKSIGSNDNVHKTNKGLRVIINESYEQNTPRKTLENANICYISSDILEYGFKFQIKLDNGLGYNDLYFDNGLKLSEVNSQNYNDIGDFLLAVDAENNCSKIVTYNNHTFNDKNSDFILPSGVTVLEDDVETFYPTKVILNFAFTPTTLSCKNIVIPETVEVIETKAFNVDTYYGSKSAFGVVGGINVNSIGESAFLSASLQFVYFPKLSHIGSTAFKTNVKLAVVGTLVDVGSSVFNNSKTIVVGNSADYETASLSGKIDGRFVRDDEFRTYYEDKTICDRIYEVYENSFDSYYLSNGIKLTDIIDPTDLSGDLAIVAIDHENQEGKLITYFGDLVNTEGDFTLVENVEIGGVTYIMTEVLANAFRYSAIKTPNLVIPDSYWKLSNNAFYAINNTNQSFVNNVVMNGVKWIGDYCFGSNSSWTFNLDSGNDNIFETEDEYYYLKDLDYVGKYAFNGCIGLTGGITFSENATSIGVYAFNGCSNLLEVIGENIVEVGEYTFNNCKKLRFVSFPKLNRFGTYSFINNNGSCIFNIGPCSNISDTASFRGTALSRPAAMVLNATSVPYGNTKIVDTAGTRYPDTYCLYICDEQYFSIFSAKVTSSKCVALPSGMSTSQLRFYRSDILSRDVDYIVCENEDSLTLVYCRKPSITTIELCEDILAIEQFYSKNVTGISKRCYGYTTITGDLEIPEHVSHLYMHSFAMFNSTATNRNSFGVLNTNNVITIEDNAFINCNIRTIEIENSVESIGNRSFYGNNTLESVYLKKNALSPSDVLEVPQSTSNFSETAILYTYRNSYDYYCNNSFGLIPASNVQFFDNIYDSESFTFFYRILPREETDGVCEISFIVANDYETTELEIPSLINDLPVVSIHPDAFVSLSQSSMNISRIILPTYLEDFTFNAESFLTTVTEYEIDEASQVFSTNDGVLYTKDYSVLLIFPIAKVGNDINTDTYIIPSTLNVRKVSIDAFVGCLYVKYVVIIDSE